MASPIASLPVVSPVNMRRRDPNSTRFLTAHSRPFRKTERFGRQRASHERNDKRPPQRSGLSDILEEPNRPYAAVGAALRPRFTAARPSPAKPISIIAHVEASGTVGLTVTLASKKSPDWTVCRSEEHFDRIHARREVRNDCRRGRQRVDAAVVHYELS